MLTKIAIPGPDQSLALEKALASMAHTEIKNKAPELLKRLVGFQLVDKTDDDRKAFGMFGCRLNDKWGYVPIIFRNGEIRGTDMLYLKDMGLMIPLKEDWLNYVLRQSRQDYGEGVRDTPGNRPSVFSSLSRYSESPFRMKAADDREYPAIHPEFGADSLKSISKIAMSPVDTNGFTMLQELLSTSDLALKRCLDGYVSNVKFKYAMDWAFDGEDNTLAFFEKAAKDCASKGPSKSKGMVARASKIQPSKKTLLGNKKVAGLVKVISYQSVSMRELTPLSTADREKLKKEQVLIQDSRDDSQVTRAVPETGLLDFITPSQIGVYDVVMDDGSLRRLVYAPVGKKPEGSLIHAVVFDPSMSTADNALVGPMDLTAHGSTIGNPIVELNKELESKPSVSSGLKTGWDTKYLIYQNGCFSAPFRVTSKTGDNTYEISFEDQSPYSGFPPFASRYVPDKTDFLSRNDLTIGIRDRMEEGDKKILRVAPKGSQMLMSWDMLSVPEDAKVISLSSKTPSLAFGNASEFSRMLSKVADSVKLSASSPGEVIIDVVYKQASDSPVSYQERLSPKSAVIHLVAKQGLREKQAEDMVSDLLSQRGQTQKYHLKRGEQLPQNSLYGFEMPDSPDGGGIIPSSRMQDIGNVDENVEYEGLQAGPPKDQDPEEFLDPELSGRIQQAVQSGQKDVFGYTAIEGLLKSLRVDTKVREAIPLALKCMSKVGELRLLEAWHRDDFEDRYGRQDLPELEDLLTQVFDGLGSLSLYLQEKESKPFGGMDGMSYPNLEETS